MNTRPPSKSFANEKLLQQFLFREAAIASERFDYCWVRREMPIGARIPDVVIVAFEGAPPDDLWPRRCTFRHAAVLATLRKRPNLRIESLARRCFETPDRIATVVSDLVRARAVDSSPGGAFRLSQALAMVDVEVTAIEAKISRWTEALAQAETYKPFADRVFVALDSMSQLSPKALDTFKRAGIGLWSTSPGALTTLVPARTSPTWTAEKEYVVASAVASQTQMLWTRR